MHSFFKRFEQLSFTYILAGGALILGGLMWCIIFLSAPRQSVEDVDTLLDSVADVVNREGCAHPRILDGVCVDTEEASDPRLVGIMIENHVDARPLSGISEAAVVYEAPVEGNYDRFFALFPETTDIEKVGPVRSARPYYLDWLSEYPGAMYMHVGGSPDALDRLAAYGLFDLNEFYRGWYYWRDTARFAPHNVYTSSNLWRQAIAQYGEEYAVSTSTPTFPPWPFRSWDECTSDCVTEITIRYAGPAYEATWRYNTSTAQYERYEGGTLVVDQTTHDPVSVDTLVVQYVDTTVLDDVGRLGMTTIGEGDVRVFRNGTVVEGRWNKPSRTDRTQFVDFDEEGHPIPFKAGKIWISVINQTGTVTYAAHAGTRAVETQ